MALMTVVYAPVEWASALVNGDYSGLSEQESAHVREWLEIEQVTIASTLGTEPFYTKEFALYDHGLSGYSCGDVLAYVADIAPVVRSTVYLK